MVWLTAQAGLEQAILNKLEIGVKYIKLIYFSQAF
jgi:hypothetical protein